MDQNLNQDLNKKLIKTSYNLALKYLAYQPRTILQMENYIKSKGYDDSVVKKVVEILLEKNYLNDEEYAKLYLETKTKYKPKAKFALRYELLQKGINPLFADNALDEYDDYDLAYKALELKMKIWRNIDAKKLKKKVLNFLKYKGFNYEVSLAAFDKLL